MSAGGDETNVFPLSMEPEVIRVEGGWAVW